MIWHFLAVSICAHAQAAVLTDTSSRYIIGNIFIEGNTKTRTSIITREMAIRPENVFDSASLAKALEIDRRKIVNTNLFVTVEMLTQPNADSLHTDLHVVVKERWYLIALPVFQLADRNFNEWWYDRNRDLSRIIYGVYVSYGNVTGRADKLRLLAEFGFIPKFEISYSLPYIDKAQKMGITVGTSYGINKTMAFRSWTDKLDYLSSEDINRRRFFAFAALTYRNKYYSYHTADLRWSTGKISDTISVLNPDYFLKGRTRQQYLQFTYSYAFDKRDNFQYPLRGHAYGAQFSKLGLLPSDDINQAYFYASYRKYFELGKRWFANTGIRGRASFPKKQPYLQTVGLGYRNDLVRGYELYVVDGQDYLLTKNEIKYRLFSFQKHFSWMPVKQFNTLPMAAYLNTFTDAGYVKNAYPELNNTQLANKFIYGAGTGIDIITFYNVVMRFTYSINSQKEGRLFFNISREF